MKSIILTLLAFHIFILSGCFKDDPTQKPEFLVREMYDALSASDMDRYMDTIHPDNRQQPNPLGLLSALSVGIGGGVGPFSLSLDSSSLLHVTFRELNIHASAENEQHIIVEAKGKIRYPILLVEMEFCEQHDVVWYENRWYIDIYHPAKLARLNQLFAAKRAKLQQQADEMPHFTTMEEELVYTFSSLMPLMESQLDLCIPLHG